MGLIPEAGSTLLLPQAIGTAKANEMLMLGRKMTAQEAVDCGLVARILPADKLDEEILTYAHQLAAKSPSAVRETKRLMRANNTPQLKERMDEENVLFGSMLKSPEFGEVVTAFFEKRAPDFSKF